MVATSSPGARNTAERDPHYAFSKHRRFWSLLFTHPLPFRLFLSSPCATPPPVQLCRYDKTGGAVGLRPTERDYIIMAGVSAFRSPPHDNQPFMYWLTGMVAWALADVNGRSYAFIAAGGVPLFVGALHATNESWLVCQCLRVLAWVFKNLKGVPCCCLGRRKGGQMKRGGG